MVVYDYSQIETLMTCGDIHGDYKRFFNEIKTHVKSNKKRIRFIFAKKRKFDRLKEILERIGVEYTETKHEYDRYTTGIKYYRITGKDCDKDYYNLQWAQDTINKQAGHFFDSRQSQITEAASLTQNLLILSFCRLLILNFFYILCIISGFLD